MRNLGINSRVQLFAIILSIAVMMGFSQSVFAAGVPDLVNYQGVLTDANGDPLTATQAALTFNVYGTATGGAAIWGPMIYDNGTGDGHGMKARLVGGRFNVVLGPVDTTGRSLSSAFTTGATRYLEIILEANPPIQPRLALMSAPYAIQARKADQAGGITGQDIKFWIEGNLQPAMVIDSEGDVGIGTNSPAAKLDVVGSASIGGFQSILTYTGGSTDWRYRYVHIRTPDKTHSLIIIGGSDDTATSGAVGVESASQGESTPDDIIIGFFPSYRHFMIEGFAPYASSYRLISKRVCYIINRSVLFTTLGESQCADLIAGYPPYVYVGTDDYIYIRLIVPTSESQGTNTDKLSFVLFGLSTASGRQLLDASQYVVTLSDQSAL